MYHQGVAQGVGLSNFGPRRLQRVHAYLTERGVAIATLQVQYSLLSTYPVTQLGLKEVCDQLGIKLIAYSPLALGLLTGKYSETGPFPPGIRGLLFRRLLPGLRPLLRTLAEVAQTRNRTQAQVALNWCICKGTLPIPGAKTLTQAQENLGALGWQLSAAEVTALDQAAAGVDRTMVQNIFQTR